MKPIEQIFSRLRRGIIRELKRRINGEFECYLESDTIYIIICPNNNITFTYAEYNIQDKMVEGISSEMIAFNAYRQYKKHVNSIFFK